MWKHAGFHILVYSKQIKDLSPVRYATFSKSSTE